MAVDAGWRLERGATVEADESVRFSVWAPRVKRLTLKVKSSREVIEQPLERREDGGFETRVDGVAAGADYFYRLDDARDRPDPVSRSQPEGVNGPSRVIDPRAFQWSDHDWRGVELAELVLYELHVGTFSEAGTFDGVIDRLDDLASLGVSAIELMPVAEFPGARNWGYDGAHPYAPHGAYGGPDGFKRLVDAAHRSGLAVVLDVVYNHLGPEGNYLGEFGPYFTDRYQTPWGQAVNFDGPDSHEVRRYFVDNALYWVSEFHLDGLRLDAVHAIYDASTRHILEEIAEAIHGAAARLGREVHVIPESNANDARLVRPAAAGGYGLDAQWNDDFHHAVHVALTAERVGYYADFGGVEPVAKVLRDRFVLDGGYSRFHRQRHGAPATDVPPERFVVFTQNHDQVGNRPRGERLASLISFEAQKLAAALLLLSPYVPLLFMGEEYGETHPFLYFVSHGDPDLIAAVREGRRKEFAGWNADVVDPQAEETFLRSRLDWGKRDRSPHRELQYLYRDLLRLRREEKALRPGTVSLRVAWGQESGSSSRSIVLEREVPGGSHLVTAFNFSESSSEISVRCSRSGAWCLRLSTDDDRYGGRGEASSRRIVNASGSDVLLSVPASSAVLYELTHA